MSSDSGRSFLGQAVVFNVTMHAEFPEAYDCESLVSDPIHGYMAFASARDAATTSEKPLIDHPWVQRLRRIHQLQSAWWVYPSAEHTRFQHVLGVMHLGGLAAGHLYASLVAATGKGQVPSAAYVQSLVRIAGLLHDVGHGPYGHFFDEHFLQSFGLTHEDLAQQIIRTELHEVIRGIRENPRGKLGSDEMLEPEHVAYLIKRPTQSGGDPPLWLRLLRGLFGGLYTVDNMDFVLRDSYMAGYGPQAFDMQRLLHYSFFTPRGLALHGRGLAALIRFIEARGELFRGLYFHRTVRAIDMALADVFAPTMARILPGNPAENLESYRRLTEWSLLTDVERWQAADDPELRRLGEAWQAIVHRRLRWKMACERTICFEQGSAELTSIFTDSQLVERRLRSLLPAALRGLVFRADVARHYHLPMSSESLKQNLLFEPATNRLRSLQEHELLMRLPRSFSICRIYALDHQYDGELSLAVDRLLSSEGDDQTNM